MEKYCNTIYCYTLMSTKINKFSLSTNQMMIVKDPGIVTGNGSKQSKLKCKIRPDTHMLGALSEVRFD